MEHLPRSWQDLGKATKELAMVLGNDAMTSNTGNTLENKHPAWLDDLIVVTKRVSRNTITN